MRTSIKITFIFVLVVVFGACEGKFESSTSLGAINLLAPLNIQECQGTFLPSGKIQIAFDWEDVAEITSYTISYSDNVTGQTEVVTSAQSEVVLDLEPGTLYMWKVIVSNGFEEKESPEFSFYTEGLSEANHVPFPAIISIVENGNNNVDINWQGADIDNDITSYQVFLSENNPPDEFIESTAESSINVDLPNGQTFYLNVLTYDENGNFSESKKTILR